jgi:hypothetical protein
MRARRQSAVKTTPKEKGSEMSVIEIYVDQVWAGSGKLVRGNDECRIEDCGAQFCDDNDESIKVYDLIEEAIEAGKKSITVELEGESKKITWTVTESGDEDQTEAQQLIAEHPNAAELLTILDNSAYPSDQDWDLGQTTWTLDDGSKIRICGNDVEAIAGNDESQKPFILVFRPHQRPAWACGYHSEDAFVSDWANGAYDRLCSCNNDLSEEEQELTYDNAFADAAHDLHCLTRLDSAEEFVNYVENYKGHNKGTNSVIEVAKQLGWITDEDDEDEDE